jgi:hypothetical protein
LSDLRGQWKGFWYENAVNHNESIRSLYDDEAHLPHLSKRLALSSRRKSEFDGIMDRQWDSTIRSGLLASRFQNPWTSRLGSPFEDRCRTGSLHSPDDRRGMTSSRGTLLRVAHCQAHKIPGNLPTNKYDALCQLIRLIYPTPRRTPNRPVVRLTSRARSIGEKCVPRPLFSAIRQYSFHSSIKSNIHCIFFAFRHGYMQSWMRKVAHQGGSLSLFGSARQRHGSPPSLQRGSLLCHN